MGLKTKRHKKPHYTNGASKADFFAIFVSICTQS